MPLDTLRVFDVAARRLSFTAAGEELGLTQGAVSQRIKSLEARLGVPLFHRLTRALALTGEGELLAAEVRGGLSRIEAGLTKIESPGGARRPLRLTLSPSLAVCWLLPRLNSLAHSQPALQIEMLAEDRLLELGVEADVAIRFGGGRYAGLKSKQVARDWLVPVCSPSFLAAHPFAAALGDAGEDCWRELPFLIDATAELDKSGCDWPSWAAATQLSWNEPAAAMRFSHAHLALRAAAEGQGITLARRLLATDDLRSGRLVPLRSDKPRAQTQYGYHVVSPADPDLRLRRLTSWLENQFQESLTDPPP